MFFLISARLGLSLNTHKSEANTKSEAKKIDWSCCSVNRSMDVQANAYTCGSSHAFIKYTLKNQLSDSLVKVVLIPKQSRFSHVLACSCTTTMIARVPSQQRTHSTEHFWRSLPTSFANLDCCRIFLWILPNGSLVSSDSFGHSVNQVYKHEVNITCFTTPCLYDADFFTPSESPPSPTLTHIGNVNRIRSCIGQGDHFETRV